LTFTGNACFAARIGVIAEEKHQPMLVQAAIFAPKTTTTKTSTAKSGTTR